MELSLILVSAALAALFAGALNALLAPVFARVIVRNARSADTTLAGQLLALGVYTCAGIGLGFLFWLSWGLAAIVGVPWWLRGLSFALVAWSAFCLPLLAAQLLALRIEWSSALVTATEWLITTLLVGMTCAWSWSRGP